MTYYIAPGYTLANPDGGVRLKSMPKGLPDAKSLFALGHEGDWREGKRGYCYESAGDDYEDEDEDEE
jgi:hypothetical protein